MVRSRVAGAVATAAVVASLGTATATAAPRVVGDPARVTVTGTVTLGAADVAARTVTIPDVRVVVRPAATRVSGLAGPSVVSVTRAVDLTALRVRMDGVTVPVTGTRVTPVAEEHVALARDDTTYQSPVREITTAATFAVPPGVRPGTTATVELAPRGMVAYAAGATRVTPLGDDAAAVRADVAERRAAYDGHLLVGSWTRALPAAGGFAYQVLDVWQLKNAAGHLAVETYLRRPGAVATEVRVAAGWAPVTGSRWTLPAGERAAWRTTLLRRPSGATAQDAPRVTVEVPGLPELGGPTDFLRVTPGSGPLLADVVPAGVLATLPAEAQAYLRTAREGEEQALAWGAEVPLATTKDHDCRPNPNDANPGEAIDLRMWCGMNESIGGDSYWTELRTKAHVVGVIVGHSATSHCWIYSVRSGTDGNFSHTIHRCRFHNSEHNDESMSAQRTEFRNCVPEWNACFLQSGVVPNDGWRTYDFVTCCDLAIPPFGVSPAQMQSVWWASNRARTDDPIRGQNTVSCTYAKIQPMNATGEAGYCNYWDGISP
jgi:hypothetical protein